MPYALPTDVDERPVTVIGGGTLGRRIAMMFAAGGSRVRLFKPGPKRPTKLTAAVVARIRELDADGQTLTASEHER